MGKLVIFSAPSGSGKTTIVRELLQRFPRLRRNMDIETIEKLIPNNI